VPADPAPHSAAPRRRSGRALNDRGDLLQAWPLPGGRELGARLAAAYARPERRYHDTRHLAEVLQRLGELAAHGVGFDALPVELAAWFHDGVYDGLPEPERRSADWAAQELPRLVAPAVVDEVVRLVLLTEQHRPADDDANGSALSDADLAILAAPAARYAEYVAAVRAEYAQVPDDLFARGRAGILRALLAKPRLFHTAHARAAWEHAARANVEHELAGLRG
jgi:predicted metal-dependent HD superfamily phosphohydrolase